MSSHTLAQGKKKTSCIIPAYNEAQRIGNVLKFITANPLIDEIIVVNDGSEDDTGAVVERLYPNVTLINLEDNKGKAFALKQGIGKATGQIILLLDADLMGLKEENIRDLIEPVMNGDTDMTLSLRRNSLLIYRILGVDPVSGERAIHKEILDRLQDFEHSRFGFESILNDYIISNKLSFQSVRWDNVRVALKREKRGFWKGIFDEIKMMGEIMEAISVHKFFYILFKMAANTESNGKQH